jgi:hypothetical protein
MTWKIEEAQEQFLEVVNASGQTPQLIYQRDRFVAAVIRADLFQEFLTWQQQQKRTSLADTSMNYDRFVLQKTIPSRLAHAAIALIHL